MNRMNSEEVSIELVIGNPLNPSNNYQQDVEQIKGQLQKNGWETPVTCYEKKGRYYILSGNRWRYAAEDLGMEKIPVFVVDAPKKELEVLDN